MLDLRRNGSLSIEDAKKISLIQAEVRVEYNDFVESLIATNEISDFQWLLQITTRNTYASWIFDSMCRLKLLECLLKEGRDITLITIDNPSLKNPILKILENYKNHSDVNIVRINRNKSFQVSRNLVKNVYVCLCLWIGSFLYKANINLNGEVYFLDSFILKKSFDKNQNFKDRYYPSLISNLPNDVKDKVWYLSTLSGIKYPMDWIKIFSHVSRSKNNILLKEYWLNFKDYLFAIWKSIWLPKTIKIIPKWGNLDISEIVLDEIKNDQASNSITQGILMYLFFKRLKKDQVEIKGIINWFENQIIDRGLYLGMNEFFPKVYIKGYLGFIPEDYYLGIFPTEYEKKYNLIPHELLVVGEAYIDKIRQYCPDLKVVVAPAFRFKHVFEFKQNPALTRNNILLALPMNIEEVRNIIKLLSKVKLDRKSKLVIKVHPASNNENIMELISKLTNINYEIIDRPLTDIFQSTRLLITTASSVALEAIACGINVAVIGNRSGPTIERLSGYAEKEYWSISYSSLELENMILKEHVKVKIDVIKYFQPINKKDTLKMLLFESNE